MRNVLILLSILIQVPIFLHSDYFDNYGAEMQWKYQWQGKGMRCCGGSMYYKNEDDCKINFAINFGGHVTKSDKFCPKNELDMNYTGSCLLLWPYLWVFFSIIDDTGVFDYELEGFVFNKLLLLPLALTDCEIYYFPFSKPSKNKTCSKFRAGFYVQNQISPYIFHRNKWTAFKLGGGLSFNIGYINLNTGILQHHETNFSKNYNKTSYAITLNTIGDWF